MCSSPKFITPLMDRSVIAGYSAAISCAVRGYPKVSVSTVLDYINPFTHAFTSKPVKQQCTLFLILFVLLPAKDYMDEKQDDYWRGSKVSHAK